MTPRELDILLKLSRKRYEPTDEQIASFMVDSNAIEGEHGLHPNDVEAARQFLSAPMTAASLLECHRLLAEHLQVDWAGRYRTCDVRVGDYRAPHFDLVPSLMAKFWRTLPKLDTFTAHNTFQKIHPFRDLNGRTGRLIWLHKALGEGYSFRISFLHAFYYDTLQHQKSDLKP